MRLLMQERSFEHGIYNMNVIANDTAVSNDIACHLTTIIRTVHAMLWQPTRFFDWSTVLILITASGISSNICGPAAAAHYQRQQQE